MYKIKAQLLQNYGLTPIENGVLIKDHSKKLKFIVQLLLKISEKYSNDDLVPLVVADMLNQYSGEIIKAFTLI